MMSLLLFLTIVMIALLSVVYYRYVLFGLAILFYLPLILQLFFLKVASQVLSWWNQKLLERGRFTLWFKRMNKVYLKALILEEDLFNAIVSFIGGKNMAITIQRPGTEVRYVPRDQRDLPAHEQTVFKFKKMKRAKLVAERDRLVGLSERGRVEALRSSSVSHQVTILQFSGWENVVDENGNPLPFDERNKEEMFDLLPMAIQDELEEEFGGGVTVKKEEAAAEDAAAE